MGPLPTWEVLRDDVTSNAALGGMGPGTGMKRGHDSVEDFFTDMKKRRVTPSYDPRQYLFLFFILLPQFHVLIIACFPEKVR